MPFSGMPLGGIGHAEKLLGFGVGAREAAPTCVESAKSMHLTPDEIPEELLSTANEWF